MDQMKMGSAKWRQAEVTSPKKIKSGGLAQGGASGKIEIGPERQATKKTGKRMGLTGCVGCP